MKHNEMPNFLINIARDKALNQAEVEFVERLKLAILNGENHAIPFASSAIGQYKELINLIDKNYSAIKDNLIE